MNRNTIITGVVALVLGLLIGWFVGQGAAPKSAMNADKMMADVNSATQGDMYDTVDMMDTDSVMMSYSDAAVLVIDQAAGNMVTVASVETDVSTWVAVREMKGGMMGNILGAARVDAGASNNVVVNLLRPTMAGGDYSVVLFADNGDKMFDHKMDMAIASDGDVISQSFMAQ